jgi:hypothetical protein
MKPSNSDLEDLWQGIEYGYEQRRQRLPLYLRLARPTFRALLECAWRRA